MKPTFALWTEFKLTPFMKRILFFCFFTIVLPFRSFAADGDSIWAVAFVHDIYFTFSQTSYWDTLLANHTAELDTRCDMIFDGRSMPSVGIKMKGNSSFNNPSDKKSFKVDLNEYVSGQDYDGIKKFNLNNGFKDPTMMREKICLDFMIRHGITAPRCTYARVYLNGVYWGLYTVVEEINSKFLKQQYQDDDGNLYKGDPNGDLKWYGSSASSYYQRYSLESDSNATSWNDLVNLVDEINNTPSSDYYDSLETVFDSWSYLNYMAACNIFVNLDSYIGSGHNYFIYNDSTGQHFRWIAWDVNEAFGNFNLGMTITQMENLPYNYVNQPQNKPLASKMLADANYYTMYINSLCNLMQDFSNTEMDAYIDSLANMIRADVYADTLKSYSNQDFENNIIGNVNQSPGLKSFIAARRSSLTSQLLPYGCWLTVEEQAAFNAELKLYPNPASDQVTIGLPAGWETNSCTVMLFDACGRNTGAIATVSGSETFVIPLNELANGIYFARVSHTDGSVARSILTVRR